MSSTAVCEMIRTPDARGQEKSVMTVSQLWLITGPAAPRPASSENCESLPSKKYNNITGCWGILPSEPESALPRPWMAYLHDMHVFLTFLMSIFLFKCVLVQRLRRLITVQWGFVWYGQQRCKKTLHYRLTGHFIKHTWTALIYLYVSEVMFLFTWGGVRIIA